MAVVVSIMVGLGELYRRLKRKKVTVPNGGLSPMRDHFHQGQAVNVVVVEDEEDDQLLFTRLVQVEKLPYKFKFINDGQEAVDYLSNVSANGLQLILLDFNLPRLSGLEVLRQIKQRGPAMFTPVVMFTGSADVKQLRLAYEAGANSCVEKPRDHQEFKRVVLALRDYWLSVNRVVV